MKLAPHAFSLRQLQYAVAVADTLSFRKAAEACRVAQPSLSAQLALLEEALGVRLFERDARRVELTPAGRSLVERARELVRSADAIVDAARTLADPFSGTLRVGVIPTLAPYLLPEIAPLLRQRYPKLAFVWTEEKTPVLVERLADSELDCAIVALEAEIGNLASFVLGKDPFLFAAAPGHALAAGKGPLAAKQLDGERVFLLDDGHCFREQALSFCSRSGAEEAGYRATSLATLVQMAAGGAGVTLLPSIAVALENRRGALTIRPFAPKAPFRTIALVWRRSSPLETTLGGVGKTLKGAYESLIASAG
jgi:LysR family hydrogen peroxide-inducible transcriptional activator